MLLPLLPSCCCCCWPGDGCSLARTLPLTAMPLVMLPTDVASTQPNTRARAATRGTAPSTATSATPTAAPRASTGGPALVWACARCRRCASAACAGPVALFAADVPCHKDSNQHCLLTNCPPSLPLPHTCCCSDEAVSELRSIRAGEDEQRRMAEILQRLYQQETEGGSDSDSEEGEGEDEGALSVETLHRLLAKVG